MPGPWRGQFAATLCFGRLRPEPVATYTVRRSGSSENIGEEGGGTGKESIMKTARQKQCWVSRIAHPAASAVLALTTVLVLAALAIPRAQAQTYTETVIHNFTGTPDGTDSYAGLVAGTSGNLYGTTALGGAFSLGAVIKVSKTGAESTLYSFTTAAGSYPEAGLVTDSAGNLYGTTYEGGASGWGSVFKLTPGGKETTLYSFAGPSGGPDGAFPLGGLVVDSAGNLYGTTWQGGTSGEGTVFKVSATGQETVLTSFDGTNGAYPQAGLVRDASGNLYGTTVFGGTSNEGTVFTVSASGVETVLHSFDGDGEWPVAGLVRDGKGNLYGTTELGGDYSLGVVFKLSASGKIIILHSFGGSDGQYPQSALVRDSSGNLYGTTLEGGPNGFGAVFETSATGRQTLLYGFTGRSGDGAYPRAALVRDAKGNLYGTTTAGGASSNCISGCGTVFELSPQ